MSPILNQAVANAKPLTDHEAAALLLEAQAGSAAARTALIEDCYDFIARQARRHRPNPCYDRNDLFAVGVQSVNCSINRFDHRILGIHFRSFARQYIPFAIARFTAEHQHTITIKEKARRQRTQTGEKVFSAFSMVPLDAVLNPTDRLLYEKLVDPTAADPSEGVETKLNREWLYGAIAAARLSARERDLLTRLFGLNHEPPQTRRVVAARYGCSHQNITEIVNKLLARLRLHLLQAERGARLCLAA